MQVSMKSAKNANLKRGTKTKRQAPLSKTDLIHIHKSPNYCVQDAKKGILGTSGRVCNKNSTGSDSCDLLCCGRGYNTQVLPVAISAIHTSKFLYRKGSYPIFNNGLM